MDAPDAVELPIFELPLAIVPDERVPLHIFEPRYRAMIGVCLERDSTFGILLKDDLGPREVGCSASVTDVVERYDDGRLDVVCRGISRFRVIERFEAEQWPAGTVEDLGPDPAAPPGPELDAARAAFAALLDAVGADAARAEAATGTYPIAAQIELPAPQKQELLEQEDERERLVAIERFLRRLLSGMTRARDIAERAKTNGHGTGRIGPIG